VITDFQRRLCSNLHRRQHLGLHHQVLEPKERRGSKTPVFG